MLKKNGYYPSLIAILCLFSSCTRSGPEGPEYTTATYVAPGVGLGTIIAVVISWSRNKSILWAIIHGLLGWIYVIYSLLFHKKQR